MSEWPAFEKEDHLDPYPATEQELSWLLPQSMASLAGELAASHQEHDGSATLALIGRRLIIWTRSVSSLNRHR
ncbi:MULTISPECIES: hypothetical protein [unclassified Pseudomonas]|uniref:hypothetical protein n=1 Tax=unclassified Pseudomonas TaxID=196821 RepID=UPI0025D5BCE1|nr:MULTISPECIES: hypothetical protein [unclassified Pseudomonas]